MRRPRARPLVAALLLAFLIPAAAAVSGCGAADTEVAGYVGAWQRVVAGAPDPSLTLVVTRSSEGATLAFTDASGLQAQGVASLEDDRLVLRMPADNGTLDAATSLEVTLGADGRLVVDRVLDDGTTEPVWIYERAPAALPSSEP